MSSYYGLAATARAARARSACAGGASAWVNLYRYRNHASSTILSIELDHSFHLLSTVKWHEYVLIDISAYAINQT